MPRRLSEGYNTEVAWELLDPTLATKVAAFSVEQELYPDETTAHIHVRSTATVGLDVSGVVVGIATVEKVLVPQLDTHMWQYRTFIAKTHRQSHLASVMLLETRNFFEDMYVSAKNRECMGMYMEVDNEMLKRVRNHAIWPNSNFVYIGKNERGDHLRVYYFPDARLTDTPPVRTLV